MEVTKEQKVIVKRKKITVEDFIKLLFDFGYEFDDDKRNFINSKSSLWVKDPRGNRYKTTWNRFKTGFRSPYLSNMLSDKEVDDRLEKVWFRRVSGAIYEGKDIPIEVICHCGNQFGVRIENIRENRSGCPECYRYNRKHDWTYVSGIADKYGCIILSEKDVYKGRETIIEVACACGTLIIKDVRSFLKAPRCKNCSIELRKITNSELYGSTNYLTSELGKETSKETLVKKYGVDHNMKVPEIQKKAQETCFENHGVYCVFELVEIQKMAKDAFIQKYNSLGALSVESLKKKYLATMMKKYNCSYPMQHPDSLEKRIKACFALKLYTFPSGKEIGVQGYEHFLIDLFVYKFEYNEEDIITGPKNVPSVHYIINGRQSRYFMDVYIPSIQMGFEVKSLWTYSLDQKSGKGYHKWSEASKICQGGLEVYVFDDKGNVVFIQYFEEGKNMGIIQKSEFNITDFEYV